MKDEQINAAVHVALGNDLGCPRCSDPECAYNSVPDYCTDLNAMHKAEKSLTVEQIELFADTMYNLCVEKKVTTPNRLGWRFALLNATAQERAEAFLRTLGKWEEN
jgi:hypothetical protein